MRFLLASLVTCVYFCAQAQQLSLHKDGDKLIFSNGTSLVTISEQVADGAFIHNDNVYFLEQNKIRVYNINSKNYNDIVAIGMVDEKGHTIKSSIENIVANPSNNKLFFTTSDSHNGHYLYMTWLYDITNEKYTLFSDGKVDKITGGVVEVLFNDTDPQGRYMQRAYFSNEGKMIKTDDRIYSN